MFGIKIKKLSLFSDMKRTLIGIELSGNNLKIAEMGISMNQKEVVNLFSRNIFGLSDSDISKIITTTVYGFRARTTGIIDVVPSPSVITKNIEIPSTDPKEITEIIGLQAGRHTPYSREEIIVDYIDIGTYKKNYTKILLVIVTRSVVNRHFEILGKAGFKLERVLFAPEAIAWSYAKTLKLETENYPVGIINIDETFTDFVIIFRSKAIFIRSIPIGAQHLIGEIQRYGARFAEELRRSLEAYQSEDIEKSPNAFVLTGAVAELTDVSAILNDALRLPIKIVSDFEIFNISSKVLKDASVSKRLSFANLMTSLFAYENMKVDLATEEIKLKKLVEERGRDLIKTGIFILTSFVLIFSILMSKIYFKSFYLKKLDKRLQELTPDAKKLENDFGKISLLKSYLLNRGYSLEVLTELYSIIPLELELNNIKFDEQGRLSLRGTASSMSTVFSFVSDMEKSKYFKEAKVKYTSKKKEGLKDVTDFEISSVLRKEVNR